MFKKVKDCIFLLGVVIIFIAFGMFLYKNPVVEGHGGGGGGHGGGGFGGPKGSFGGGHGRGHGGYYYGGYSYGGGASEVNPLFLNTYASDYYPYDYSYGYPPIYTSAPVYRIWP